MQKLMVLGKQITNLFVTIAYSYFVYILPPTGPPILECVDPPNPFDPDEFFSIRDMAIGCDLCIEPGQSFAIVTIMCVPRTSRTPFDCIMTTPNGTNVLDIVDPSGNEITVQRAGDIVSSVSIAPVENPDARPLGFDVLGTWTCRCNNSDGRSVASSKLGSCCELNSACHVHILTECLLSMYAGQTV